MILCDRQIKELAENGMIEPFEPKLIRQIEDRRVISYGLSSYGYDIRLSPLDFRVFQHIPGTVVNPKRFNAENLRSVELDSDTDGEFFILPAHSYGLGVAREWLNLPDDVTAICMGKSTYARCFTGYTKVKLVDGDFTFLELIERANAGDRLFGFGVLNNEIVVQELVNPRYIEHSSLVRVTLDSGEFIDCTPDHQFMLRNGFMCEAQHLKSGQSLRPIYQHHSHGYPTIYDSVKANTQSSRLLGWQAIHLMVWDCLVRMGFSRERQRNQHIHHIDGNIFNSHPSNLECISNSDHAKLHNEQDGRYLKGGDRFKWLYQNDPQFTQRICSRLHSEESKSKAKQNAQWWKHSEANQQNLSNARKRRWEETDQRSKQSELSKKTIGSIKRRDDITVDSLTMALLQAGTIRGAAKILNVDRSAFKRFPDVVSRFKNGDLQCNHKVVSVEPLFACVPTYCLTAPETGNFALSAGVFVSNCGVIANLTPAEAAWRGNLTLEFSNSSSADARIYANEGVVQLLFFRGEPCEVSYAARQGKYQNQAEVVTLARV